MARLTTLRPGGLLTPAVSSQISDGAAAVLIASERAVKTHGLTPRARVHHISVLGDDAVNILTAPLPATDHALRRAGMTIGDIDLYEVNEAFASVPMAWLKHVGADPDKTESERWSDRARTSPGRVRRPIDDHPAPRTRTRKRPLRTTDHV